VKPLLHFSRWFVYLFDPPPRNSMTFPEKVWRIVLVSVTLVVTSILAAMLAALGLYLVEQGRQIVASIPRFKSGLAIVAVGLVVNSLCVWVLFVIIKADHKLMASTTKPGEK